MFDEEGRLIADLAHPGARALLARGGLGGHGNKRFATPTEQAPRLAEVGQAAEEGTYELRLKLLADAALLGFPNAGKSSLLRRISNAKPKVAEYPFTTLAPVLGTVEAGDGRQLTVADVPGLVEGASEGIGLGHEFLAHLERARLFLHVIDVTEDVAEQFHAIDRELAAYGAGLAGRPQIVVLNKLDLLPEAIGFPVSDPRVRDVVAVSAATGAGIDDLRRALFEHVPAEAPALGAAAPADDELADFLVYRPKPPRRRPLPDLPHRPRLSRVTGPAAEELDPRRAARGAAHRRARSRATRSRSARRRSRTDERSAPIRHSPAHHTRAFREYARTWGCCTGGSPGGAPN